MQKTPGAEKISLKTSDSDAVVDEVEADAEVTSLGLGDSDVTRGDDDVTQTQRQRGKVHGARGRRGRKQ